MSNSYLCDLNKEGKLLKIYHLCSNPRCMSQKQITFSAGEFMLEDGGFKSKIQKNIKCTQTAWTKFLNQAINAIGSLIRMTLAAKNKNPHVRKATTISLKSIG